MSNSPFARLLGLQRKVTARDQLHELRVKHALSDGDPVWELVAHVEEFCMDLTESVLSREALPPTNATPSAPAPAHNVGRLAALCCAGAAAQTWMLALSFYVGTRATAVKAHWWTTALTVPAGWVVVVLALPLAIAATCWGWAARSVEPAIGWGLMMIGSAALVGLGTILCHLF